MKLSPDSVAALIAQMLKRRGVQRVYALCGGHIMPRASASSTCATSAPPYIWLRPKPN